MGHKRQIEQAVVEKLRALSAQSMRQAGDSLTAFLSRPVHLEVPEISSLPVAKFSELLLENGVVEMVALQSRITGEGGGHMVILFPMLTVFRILRALLGTSDAERSLSTLEQSALAEVGNVLASAFLTELSQLTGKRLLPCPPQIHVGDISLLVQRVMASLTKAGSEVLVVRGLIHDSERHITGNFFILPEVASLEPMVHAAEEGRR